MTGDDTKLITLATRRGRIVEEIAETVRAIVPVLKDHNLPSLATQLAAKILDLDLVTDELKSVVRSHLANSPTSAAASPGVKPN